MPDEQNVLDSEVWNCPNAFDNLCPMRWEELSWTLRPGVRFCKVCQKKVFKVSTPEQFIEHGNAGHCVAIKSNHRPSDMEAEQWLGEPSDEMLAQADEAAKRVQRWWAQVVISEPKFESEAMEVVKGELKSKASRYFT